MKETLEDPEIEKRAIDKAVKHAAPMRFDETMEQYARRVAEYAVREFEIEIDLHHRKQSSCLE